MSDKPFRTGRTAAKKAAKEQRQMIATQRQRDELELAEAEGEISRRRALAGSGGRRSLLKTSETGVRSNNLGGTI